MSRTLIDRPRYEQLRQGRRTLGLLGSAGPAWIPGAGPGNLPGPVAIAVVGCAIHLGRASGDGLDRAPGAGRLRLRGLGRRQLIKVAAEFLTVLADDAEANWHTNELIERHVVPALGRIALALERLEASGERTTKRERP